MELTGAERLFSLFTRARSASFHDGEERFPDGCGDVVEDCSIGNQPLLPDGSGGLASDILEPESADF